MLKPLFGGCEAFAESNFLYICTMRILWIILYWGVCLVLLATIFSSLGYGFGSAMFVASMFLPALLIIKYSISQISFANRKQGVGHLILVMMAVLFLTYLLLFLRVLGDQSSLYIFDIMIGVTLAFHIGCFRSQIGLHQTDITSVGAFRSALFIVAMWIVNLSVLLLSIRYGVFKAFKELAIAYYNSLHEWCKFAVDFVMSYFGK